MSSRFSRFLHLERSRGEKPNPDGQVRLRDGSRFESVAGPGEARPSTVAVPEAHVERFKLHGQTPLALDDVPAEGQRFPRCVRCQAENGRFVRECTTCGADLQSPEQLAYNEELWRSREQAEAQTREQMEVHQKARQESEAAQLAERQRYAEQMHRALAQDRSFLGKLQPLFTPCLGVGLLRLIPHPLARWMSLAWAIVLPILLVRFGNEPLRMLGFYLGVLVFVSFVPTSLLTAGRRW
ncbi:hypothetical protein [Archangium sp.]|uniref:hypothetical protein n=1 Tax=Archangium sp. TaxID=1872627 RepID=UPI002D61475A|nr:hypothetical protein [Archangium sp.]HYO51375.1 hypothetical protein [Archangium sp.]